MFNIAHAKRIFHKQQLRPAQLRTVADRRWGDARCLYESGRNARANGAMYLGGFVIECLLKAKLLEKYRWLGNAVYPLNRSKEDQRIWSLCYRSHNLDEILNELPDVMNQARLREQEGKPFLTDALKSLCGEWTIYIRYSPLTANITEAGRFLDRVEEIKQWLS